MNILRNILKKKKNRARGQKSFWGRKVRDGERSRLAAEGPEGHTRS